MTEPVVLPPTEGDLAQLRARIEEMKKSADADAGRIAKLEARVDAQQKLLDEAKKKVHEASQGLLDLF